MQAGIMMANAATEDDRLHLLAEVASWYFEDGLNQDAIAQRIGLSRSMVSHLLREARERGLVEIRVHHPLRTNNDLEQRLCAAFGLAQARVLADIPDDAAKLRQRLGGLGARTLRDYIRDHVSIGVGWGSSVHEIVQAVPSLPVADARVIQIIGAVGSNDPTVDAAGIARSLAEKLHCDHHSLPAPLLVENEVTVRSLLQNPVIAATLGLCSEVEVALLGVGTTDPELGGLRRAGYVSPAELASLREMGAVGDMAGYHLDIHGRLLDLPINRKVVGITLNQLRAIPYPIVAAHGAAKVPAILGVLRGRYAHTFITDAATAAAVLDLHHRPPDAA